MSDELTSGDIPEKPKREWYDGIERVCSGSIVEYRDAGRQYSRPLRVHETPREVRRLMDASKPGAMIELHHHSDPNASVYIRNRNIVCIDVCWEAVDED